MDTVEQVKQILAKRVDISSLTLESSLTDLGLDSLDLVEIMIEIEETTGIEFDNEEIAHLHSLKEVVDLINAKKNK